MVHLINSEDGNVVKAVEAEAEPIARTIEWAAERLERGGRLGLRRGGDVRSSGRARRGGMSSDISTAPEMVVGLIAGGAPALIRAVEGAEDDPDRGAADIMALDVNKNDLVIGIATSGRTPYVLGACASAAARRGNRGRGV